MSQIMARPVSLVVHETVYPLIKQQAEKVSNGNVNMYIRAIVYAELVREGCLTPEQLQEIFE